MFRIFTLVIALATVLTLHADEWPQYMGPQRDGIWRETGILEKFPDAGLKPRWRTPIGAGFSGPSVVNGKVYVMDRTLPTGTNNPKNPFARGMIPGTERVLCLDENDGKILWTHSDDCPYDVSYASGPRSTPNVVDGKVYTQGVMGNLLCLNAETGEQIWSHDYKKDYGATTPTWGFSSNPLVDGKKVIAIARGPGSTVVCYDKDTGKEIWKALTDTEPGYCTPVIYEVGGKRQLIIWLPKSLNSLDPETGTVYWTLPFTSKMGLTAPMPRLIADKDGPLLFVASFYNGSMMARLDAEKPAAKELWRAKSFTEMKTDTLNSIMPTPWIEDGYIYGVCSYGQFRCLKVLTGERVWESFIPTGGPFPKPEGLRWANTFFTKNGDRFFFFNEKGDLLIGKLSPKGYEEISRTHIIDPTNPDPGRPVVWSYPA